ncbi:MAG: asparagine synthase C-terminal domain-containing protein, partial [Sedimenticola sp.]|nr:asparagine synthase C-terminal domain-containing protein [Sedimenticola sp.]
LSGDFVCAIIDSDNSRLILVTDRLGRHPLYYSKTDTAVVFATTPSSLYSHPAVNHELQQQGIYNYVYFHMVPSPSSIYRNVHKLPAATLIDINSGHIKSSNYWLPSFTNNSSSSFRSLGLELRRLLKQSVERELQRPLKTGGFLSGGLDSSTVVGMLSELSENQTEAFSIGFSAEGYDEMAFARITAKHFGVKLHEYYVTPDDVVTALPLIATSYDEPFGNSSALPAFFCAKFAKEHGIERLLAGDGGDELFAGNERYAKQIIFDAYAKVPAWIRDILIEPLSSALPPNIALFRKIKSYISQANTPLPDRLQTYNFLQQHKPEEIFTTSFLSDVDPLLPMYYQREIYNRLANSSTLNRMLYLDWQYTLADNDLRKVSHACSIAGIKVSYPMLDDTLVQFSTSIPDNWKIKGRKLRHFYKESLRGWLPDQTISKKKQGFGLPFGVWMRTHKQLQELAYDNLSELKKRDYFNKQFIDQVIKLHREGHASYYGELVWILTVLELWLQSHKSKCDSTISE